MSSLETSLNGSNDPIGPAKPKAGPLLPIVVAAAAIPSKADSPRSVRAASISSPSAPSGEAADVEQHEHVDGAQRPVLDDDAVHAAPS